MNFKLNFWCVHNTFNLNIYPSNARLNIDFCVKTKCNIKIGESVDAEERIEPINVQIAPPPQQDALRHLAQGSRHLLQVPRRPGQRKTRFQLDINNTLSVFLTIVNNY